MSFRFQPGCSGMIRLMVIACRMGLAGFVSVEGAERVLRLARPSDAQQLDSNRIGEQEDIQLAALLHLPLLDLTNRTELVPCAARDWVASPDQRLFRLRLREDVRFSTGRPAVAADYVYGMERMLDPATAAPLGAYYRGIAGAAEFTAGKTNHLWGLRALEPFLLEIELLKPDPTFLYNLTLGSSGGVAVPAEMVKSMGVAFGHHPVGTGPYRMKEWVRGVRLTLVPNPHYGGPQPRHFDRVEVMIGGDESTHLMMFERGELDLASINGTGIPLPSLARIRNDPKWRELVESVPIFNWTYLTLNVEIPPLDNVLVRRAIQHAIHRDRWMRVPLLYRHSEGPTPPGLPGFDPKLRGLNYDPERARALLRESGLPLPIRTTLWAPYDSEEGRVNSLGFQSDLKAVGIELEIKPVTGSAGWAMAHNRRVVPMFYSSWNVSLLDPLDMLGNNFDGREITENSVNNNNLSFYNNPEVNRLLDEAASTVNLTKRYQRFARVESLILNDVPCVSLGHKNLLALRQPWIKGPLIEPIFWYRFDRIWSEQ